MRMYRMLALLLCAVATVAGLAPPVSTLQAAPPPPPGGLLPTCASGSPTGSGNAWPLISGNNDFGFRLFVRLRGGHPHGNVFISPASAALALDLTLDGAQGTTREQMARTLGLAGMTRMQTNRLVSAYLAALRTSDKKVQLRVANSVWSRQDLSFRSAFLNDARQYFAAQVASLDFGTPQALAAINGWITCATRGEIQKVVDRIPPDAAMLLVNALYFHGDWTNPFLPRDTGTAPFTTGTGAVKKVKMMRQTMSFPYAETPELQAVSLPYGSGRFSMAVVLPRPGLPLRRLERRLTALKWRGWMQSLRSTEVALSLPRFQLHSSFSLKPALQGLGMRTAFSAAANFSGMCTVRCYISKVLQKTVLKVYEKGATAAASTAVVIKTGGGGGPPPPAMVVDRPFLLAIRDRVTGAILFLGSVMDPASQ